ncbi:hypothetical protein NECAME_03098 [Necator americanus]|uniref:Uncharacterized protein n=1 Tax=Necator americanus TaxID=51031 RepID=W2T6P2_NECAM|nr:hypothetical protein NECAME_03098 [Necator americanus]ETN77680.1 hypothetical protein NECAME_03098 [Necator americanus]
MTAQSFKNDNWFFHINFFNENSEECVHVKRSSHFPLLRGSSLEISFSVAHLNFLPTDRGYYCRILLDGAPIAAKAYDAGTNELAGSLPGESRNCMN